MAIKTMTAALVATLGFDGVEWGQRTYNLHTESDVTGASQDRPGGPPRWLLTLRPPEVFEDRHGVLWEDLRLSLRGSVNHFAAWDPKRPAPRGTMRGTMTLNGAHAAGATTVNIIVTGTGQVGATLLAGSPLQLGTGIGTSQLVRTIGDATAVNTAGNSTISVTVEAPLRTAFSGGAAVTWDKALAYFKCITPEARWSYHTGRAVRHSAVDFVENWTP